MSKISLQNWSNIVNIYLIDRSLYREIFLLINEITIKLNNFVI